jgi:uncharacterized protein YndB with AHSA1/START domain
MIEASTNAVVHETDYPHPIELVWKAITDSSVMSEWLMANDFAPQVGHKFKLTDPNAEGWSGVVECEVLELNEPNRLSYTWNGGFPTTVNFILTPTDSGTHVRVEQVGFESAGDFGQPAWKGADYFWGQKTLPGTLREAIEKLAQA